MRKLQTILFATVSAAVLAGCLYTAHLNASQTAAVGQVSASTQSQGAVADAPSGQTSAKHASATTKTAKHTTGNLTSGGKSGAAGGSTGMADGTFTGTAASTPYGDIQVTATVKSGKITAVAVPVHPDGSGRDVQINQRAIPILVGEALSKQSAKVDMVSGATFTSEGYRQSLQSALDKAGA